MDSFDDLLAPSHSVLESNPFEDPFGKRSGSPDPWSSAYQQPPTFDGHGSFGGGFGESSTSPAIEQFSHTDVTGGGDFGTPSDPLDSAAATRDDDAAIHDGPPLVTETSPKTNTPPSSPGFRESIPAVIDEVIAPPPAPSQSPPSPEPEDSTTPVPTTRHKPAPLSSITPVASDLPILATPSDSPISVSQPIVESSRASTQSHTSSPLPVSAATSPKQPVFSPLDRPQAAGLGFERSFAGLSIGGETSGGWGGAPGPFGATHFNQVSANQSEDDDDDDDDDKPILQTRASLQAQAAAAAMNVCT